MATMASAGRQVNCAPVDRGAHVLDKTSRKLSISDRFRLMEKLAGLPLLPTAIVGSYPQPDWLIDKEKLKSRLPPRVRAKELWKVPESDLADAQEAATLVAISDQKLAGIDIVGDGEMRRESYSNALANSLSGIDIDKPGSAMDRTGNANPVPRVAGRISRLRAIEGDNASFLKQRACACVKITLPGPFTMTQQAQNDFYATDEALAMDYAVAVNEELKDLFARGVDIVQLDEPYLQARADKARAYAIKAIDKAIEGVGGLTALHICFGYAYVHSKHGGEKQKGYDFLGELNESKIDIISLEAAQPGLDPEPLGCLDQMPGPVPGPHEHLRAKAPQIADSGKGGCRGGPATEHQALAHPAGTIMAPTHRR